jgi:hypothetical protein
MTMKENVVKPRYVKGQKVVIQPVSEEGLTQREYDIYTYAGQVGEISNYYWISPRTGQIFYIYNVRVGKERKEIAAYEDELQADLT